MKNTSLKVELLSIGSILMLGLVQYCMSSFVPVAGGGMGLLLVLTIPVNIGLAILFSIIHFILWKKNKSIESRVFVHLLSFVIILFITFCIYPYG